MYELLGVDVVSLANNHAYDYGEEALLDTFTTLENAGIPYAGAGRNIEEARKPVYFIANGIKIAVVSAAQIERNAVPDTKEATAASPGVLRCMEPAALLEVIAEAKANSDFVILYIHWGTESQAETDWLQDKQAPIYAQAGVDLIIGDHPHCLQSWIPSQASPSCTVWEITGLTQRRRTPALSRSRSGKRGWNICGLSPVCRRTVGQKNSREPRGTRC